MEVTTIDEVLSKLESIIDESIKTNNRAGYFAALYHKVTSSVKQGIQNNQFEDGKRMEAFDVFFANRYLLAYKQWQNKKPTTGSWRVAFATAEKSLPIVLQHLLLGMNAHINLDLGIATVEAAKDEGLENMHKDFDRINTIISSLTYQLINELDHISPLLSLMGLHTSNNNSILIQFSIDNARDGAWLFAEELSKKTGSDYDNCISERDNNITKLAESLINTNSLIKITLWIIHLIEWKKPSRIIMELRNYQKSYLKISQIKSSASSS